MLSPWIAVLRHKLEVLVVYRVQLLKALLQSVLLISIIGDFCHFLVEERGDLHDHPGTQNAAQTDYTGFILDHFVVPHAQISEELCELPYFPEHVLIAALRLESEGVIIEYDSDG